ncbi:predicted protein [Phaeodactylum tricornutum CCAP 1055/1]|uniref:Uncharacterized protein n=1 Tax=Phaeodactylum tricornutum (strain CCAP 1055/1) TaxID=556484 RepID=B7FRG6_PHATC|nr:predicted protein [Phaeodactylum tricornutum CCAP 1055/1]EEC51004.1 predicted protein [Phaeodactylum tricornutum CCAP 1055/1]|eukprot:XP_002176541.1 predicted protein [Phaeodactylum tricornutum CCAP 1055/1]
MANEIAAAHTKHNRTAKGLVLERLLQGARGLDVGTQQASGVGGTFFKVTSNTGSSLDDSVFKRNFIQGRVKGLEITGKLSLRIKGLDRTRVAGSSGRGSQESGQGQHEKSFLRSMVGQRAERGWESRLWQGSFVALAMVPTGKSFPINLNIGGTSGAEEYIEPPLEGHAWGCFGYTEEEDLGDDCAEVFDIIVRARALLTCEESHRVSVVIVDRWAYLSCDKN